MIGWREGTVTAIGRRWRGAVEIDVTIVRRADGDPPVARALAYPPLVGEPAVGDRVLLNVSALLLGLGTGGYALVVALPDRLPPDPPVLAGQAAGHQAAGYQAAGHQAAGHQAAGHQAAGHVVKARYTPLQAVVLGVDEDASPHRDTMSAATDLAGMPVVVADLHSAVPAILAGIIADRPDARVGYVMTDGGALPAWFSRTLAGLDEHLAGTVTVGQAFGGTLEATNVHSGLLAARYVLRADATIVAQGPGNLGTGTVWGFPAPRRVKRSTRPRCSVAARSVRCASPTLTRATGTLGCRITA